MQTEESSWKVLDAYFRSNSLVDNQILSFNDFLTFGIQEIIDQNNTLTVPGYTLTFGSVYLPFPEIIEDDRKIHNLSPGDARLRGLSYDTTLCCDIKEQYYADDTKDERVHTRVMLGRIPIMVRSQLCNLRDLTDDKRVALGECKNDLGGYFIIQGKERVLVAQMRGVYNQIFVSKQKPDKKYKYVAEVRSMSNETGHSVLIQAMLGLDERSVYFSLPYIKKPIPVGVVFKAMGFVSEQDIISLIGCDTPFTKYIQRDSFFCQTQKEALSYIGKFAMHTIPEEEEDKYAWQVVENEVLPHFGISGTLKEQAIFLGGMVRKLLRTYLGQRRDDDRDNYANKRVDTAGSLMYELFRNLFKRFIGFMEKQLKDRKQRPDILSIIARNRAIITKGFHQCMTSGNWSVQKNGGYVKKGVAQVLDRITYCATLSHERRVNIPVGREGKNIAIRQIHGSSFGFVSLSETPEGQKVGVVLNLAITAKITRKTPTLVVKKGLSKISSIIPVDTFDLNNILTHTPVLLNGVVLGFSKEPQKTVDEIRRARRMEFIDSEVSVTYDSLDNEIKIFSDDGRFSRPLLRLENNRLLLNTTEGKYDWGTLISKGQIENLDASEIENIVIAMTQKDLEGKLQYHYREIHPTVLFGVLDSVIPSADHTQSPRNCYQCSMGKQAFGMPIESYNQRADTILHVLGYPQKPLVYTKYYDYLNLGEMPSGMNTIVAIATYTGFNQEDSCIVNRSAIERGLFCLTSYNTIECSEKKRDTYSFEQICLPPQTTENLKPEDPKYFRRKNANYTLLDENGIIVPRRYRKKNGEYFGPQTYVKKGDVLVGKVIITGNKNGEEKRVDASLVIQHDQEGYIDRIYSMITPNGYKLIKIVIRDWRLPEIGDKLAGRSAQKATIGMVLRQEDMPFTRKGITPDIIINPCCITSRMTLNQLIEVILGKKALYEGVPGDATAFTEYSTNIADKVSEALRKYGFDPFGNETMINGMTGEPMVARIFIGSTYYQRLKHMVDDKMHARARGAVTMLTRQPLEGRSRDGGLRLGEMERDALLSHGGSRMLRERLHEVSDPFKVSVCKKCKAVTAKIDECHMCKGDDVVPVPIPYASKLMLTELNTLALKIGINVN